MTNFPRISIVTPSFNQAQYLAETIESILAQDYPNLEYMVIDGGSTDGSVDIIRRYEDRLAYWCSKKDDGQSDAIMKGFNRCTGELFAWVNSDDVLFPGSLKTIAECYLKNSKPDIIHANVAYIDSQSKITRLIRVPRQSRFFFFRGVWHCSAPAVFFGSALFRRVGGLNRDLHLCMDLDIWLRLVKTGATIANDRRYLGGFRWHDSSKSVQSLKTRQMREDPEVSQTFGTHLPKSNPMKRALWRKLYKVYQVLNLNYLLAGIQLRSIKEPRRWQDTFNASPFVAPHSVRRDRKT